MNRYPVLPTCRIVPGSPILKGVATERDYGRFDREMFGDVAAQAHLFEALKRAFDPQGVLNPGLFAGEL